MDNKKGRTDIERILFYKDCRTHPFRPQKTLRNYERTIYSRNSRSYGTIHGKNRFTGFLKRF
jgi:hypothetical protein